MSVASATTVSIGNVVRQHLAVGVEDVSTFGINRLLVNVLLRCDFGVLVVLEQLQINQTK